VTRKAFILQSYGSIPDIERHNIGRYIKRKLRTYEGVQHLYNLYIFSSLLAITLSSHFLFSILQMGKKGHSNPIPDTVNTNKNNLKYLSFTSFFLSALS